MTGPFGVDYREVSKAQVKLSDDEKKVAGGVGAGLGAYVGHWAYLTPDHAYNEKIHKPWFDYNQKNALKNPMPEEVERAKKTVEDTDKKQAASWDQNKKKAAQMRDRASLAPKEMYPGFEEKQAKSKQTAANFESTPPKRNNPEAYDKAQQTIKQSQRKNPHVSNMTRQQSLDFIEYTRKPPEHLQREYGYNPEKSSGSPENAKALGKTNWHKSKGFFRNFPSDIPGSRYRRAGGWYSKGKTGHAVATGAMAAGAYLGYKGAQKVTESKPLNNKVEKGFKKPKFLKKIKYVPQDKANLAHWDKVIRDPGFITPAVVVTGATGAGITAADRRNKKNRKKELT